MKKSITFSVPIKRECDNGKTIAYKLRFMDSVRFMSTSLSELVDNMSGIFNSIECKSCMEKIKINLECRFVGLRNNRLIYRCRECKEEWKRPIEGLMEMFPRVKFLAERKKVEKVEKLICSIEDKDKYVIQIRALKQTLNHWLISKKCT